MGLNCQLTGIAGLVLLTPFSHADERGSFVKPFHAEEFEKNGLRTDFRESFYSTSKKGVIRGMHFQKPPHEHLKLVFVTAGQVTDVVLDLRKNSPTYGQALSFELSAENKLQLYIPVGCAHGFCVRSEEATVIYFTTKEHHAASDSGILYNSFGFNWGVENPVLSERDLSFERF